MAKLKLANINDVVNGEMIQSTINNKNYLTRSSILFLTATLIPILPSGGFFSGYSAVFFWINYAFLINAKPYSKSE